MFHLLIGTKILMNTPEEQLEDSIFDIVPHMTVGQEYLQIESQKYEVAELNLIGKLGAVFPVHTLRLVLTHSYIISSWEKGNQNIFIPLRSRLFPLWNKPFA